MELQELDGSIIARRTRLKSTFCFREPKVNAREASLFRRKTLAQYKLLGAFSNEVHLPKRNEIFRWKNRTFMGLIFLGPARDSLIPVLLKLSQLFLPKTPAAHEFHPLCLLRVFRFTPWPGLSPSFVPCHLCCPHSSILILLHLASLSQSSQPHCKRLKTCNGHLDRRTTS